MKVKRLKQNALARRLSAGARNGSNAKNQPVEEESDDGSEFDFDNAIPETGFSEVKNLNQDEEMDASDSGDDADRELQIALRDGLLKTDRLNYAVEKKRPVINKTNELRAKLAEVSKKFPWAETLDVVTPRFELDKKVENDDFQRELGFYKQAEKAVQIAVPRLLNSNIKVLRPDDYYAEMAKTDDHMQKVRKRLIKIQAGKERQEAIRRMREEKKFASKVQKEVNAAKNTEKKQLAEAVKKHKKGMKQQLEDMLNNVKRMGLDKEDEEEDGGRRDSKPGRGGKSFAGPSRNRSEIKRKFKADRFGYGGKKKGSKRNTKESFENLPSGRRGGFGGRGGGGGRGGSFGRGGSSGRGGSFGRGRGRGRG
ncbi:unnamed protein product [Caenorhabditis auriculariae]|uniref:Uncharacterized protein n=1 Tax=Caenorhabditis auriculariae TaxID=2777116 RepID=A0A8S1HD24_9PELO|nr:unnamed protein product [Caenorhabditis auriculariae]